jgi:phage terminase large subunit-like protein
MLLVIRSLRKPGLYWWVAPSAKQSEAGIMAVWSALAGLSGVKFLKGISRFILPNGSIVQFMSADGQKSLVGFGLSGLVVDEAALINGQTFFRELLPACLDKDAWIVLCSTPRGFNWLVDYREATVGNPDWQHFSFPTWSNPSPNTSYEKCLAKKTEMGENVWRQEHVGEPTASEFALWPPEFFRDIFVPEVPRSYARSALGIDLSEGKPASHWQALIHVGHAAGIHYLDCRAHRLPVPSLLREAKKMTDCYGTDVVIVDVSGGQSMVHEQLDQLWPQRRGVKPVRFEIKEHVEKTSRIHQLSYLLDNKMVRVLNNAGGQEYVKEGRDFPDGEYDDLLDAHQLAWRGLHAPVAA